MITDPTCLVEMIIKDYMEQKEKSLYFHKKKNDAEKEYNKLLVTYGGEIKNFTLEQADRIYKAYRDMQLNEEEAKKAEADFEETELKLKEIGRILFHATISAEILVRSSNGTPDKIKEVTISFPNGEVFVN